MSRPIDVSVLAHPQKSDLLDLEKRGTLTGLVVTKSPRTSSLGEVVSTTKQFFESPLAKWDGTDSDKLSLSSRASVFLRLHMLNDEVSVYNEEIENDLCITILHVILAILTIGIFYLREALKIQSLALEAKKFVGVENKEAGALLQKELSFEDLYRLSPESREELVKGLGYEKTYALWKEPLDAFASLQKSDPLVTEALARPLASLEGNPPGGNNVELSIDSKTPAEEIQKRLLHARKDLLLVALLTKSSPAPLQDTIIRDWSLEQISSVFSAVDGGKERWEELFRKQGSRDRFANCSQEKVQSFLTDRRFELIRELDEGFSLFFYLLSKEHWERLDAEAIECFAKIPGAIEFDHLTLTMEEFLALPAAQTFIEKLQTAGPDSPLFALCRDGKVPELVAPKPPHLPNTADLGSDIPLGLTYYAFLAGEPTNIAPAFSGPGQPLSIDFTQNSALSPLTSSNRRKDSVSHLGEPSYRSLRKVAVLHSSAPSSPKNGSDQSGGSSPNSSSSSSLPEGAAVTVIPDINSNEDTSQQ